MLEVIAHSEAEALVLTEVMIQQFRPLVVVSVDIRTLSRVHQCYQLVGVELTILETLQQFYKWVVVELAHL